jgi:toxin-antitoxin system PIN domain toxin
MKIVDANVLLHAVNEDSEHHVTAREWLDGALVQAETIGFAWSAVLAFLRVSTHPAVFARPLTTEESVATIRTWLAQPSATVVEPTPRHLSVLGGLLVEAGTAGNLVNDAHLAAVAIENAAELISYDSDFGRFEGLIWGRPTG